MERVVRERGAGYPPALGDGKAALPVGGGDMAGIGPADLHLNRGIRRQAQNSGKKSP